MDENDIDILHIASGDLWAGAEAQLLTLCIALTRLDNTNVHVILMNHGTLEKRLIASGINVTVFPESELNGFQILQKLTRNIKKSKPDVIHTHRSKENILGSIAALFPENPPTLRTVHGAPEHKPVWFHLPKQLVLSLDMFCGRHLQDRIIAVSQDLAGILKKIYPEHKICTIENGIDLNAYAQEPDTAPKNKDDSTVVVGIAGRLVPVKRIDIFIKAAQYLKSTHPELKLSFHIYGDGPLKDDLHQLSRDLQTENIVCFKGHCENIKAELEMLDILLMTSDHEGLPMILLEAMAARVPIIAHATGGISNLLDHGKCGVLVRENNHESYAKEIYKIIQHPEEKLQITNSAFNRLTRRYSAEQNAKNYLRVYKELVQKNRT